jgi:hypothetical protein
MDERDQLLRLKSLIDDLKKLATGWTPDAEMLGKAPPIEDWYADLNPGSRNVCLVGKVTGHPLLGDKVVTTSPVMGSIRSTVGRARITGFTGSASARNSESSISNPADGKPSTSDGIEPITAEVVSPAGARASEFAEYGVRERTNNVEDHRRIGTRRS